MREQDARDAVYSALGRVAPDIDTVNLDEGSRLRQDLDLDSLDFLHLLETVAQLSGVDTAERDYGEVVTVKGLIAYVATHG